MFHCQIYVELNFQREKKMNREVLIFALVACAVCVRKRSFVVKILKFGFYFQVVRSSPIDVSINNDDNELQEMDYVREELQELRRVSRQVSLLINFFIFS